jgi:hypothetical protein
MKNYFLILFPLLLLAGQTHDSWFTGSTLRIDLYHTGTADTSFMTLGSLSMEGAWYGPRKNLIDPFENGKYRLIVRDKQTDKVLLKYYYNSLFGEWQTTAEAKNSWGTMEESLYIPFPAKKIVFRIEERTGNNSWRKIIRREINPEALEIKRENARTAAIADTLLFSGNLNRKVDIAVIAEGYTESEKAKFSGDAKRLFDKLFSTAPYVKFKDRFNIWLVFVPSADSGPDNPARGKYSRTAVDASFYTFGSQRYLMTTDNRAIHDAVINVPHDQIYILVNEKEYGGGGIFNFYNVTSVDNPSSDFVFVHEFGHGFAGLADEYYSSETGYDEFYARGVEPSEPNITAVTEKEKLKWKDLVKPETPVPTPWNKEEFDKREADHRRKLGELKDREAIRDERESFAKWKKNFYRSLPYGFTVGAYEGAGYLSRGLYRPYPDCIMRSRDFGYFCPVCERAITERIHWVCDE